jgi:hypothetical protein
MVVSQDQRPVAAEIVDVFVAVHVPFAGTVGSGDVDAIGRQVARIVGDANSFSESGVRSRNAAMIGEFVGLGSGIFLTPSARPGRAS